jgi:pre-rRNA-processing protein TSR4
MPNLINLLREKEPEKVKALTDEVRTKAVEAALKKEKTNKEKGMDWGTCLVFSCGKDCRVEVGSREELKDVWREEIVLIQADT